jgi:DNA-binding NarL/FixJ family response regulator
MTLVLNQKEELIFRAKDLEKEGKTQRQIAQELDLGLRTVNKYLKA